MKKSRKVAKELNQKGFKVEVLGSNCVKVFGWTSRSLSLQEVSMALPVDMDIELSKVNLDVLVYLS